MAQITRKDAEVLIPTQEVDGVFEGIVRNSKILSVARRLPNMTSDKTELKVLDGLPVTYFLNADTETKKTSELAWKGVYIHAAELAVIIPIAESVLADSSIDVWSVTRPRIEEQAAKEIDAAILTGQGKPEKWGASVLERIVSAGALVTASTNQTFYSTLNDAFEKVELSGYDVNAILGGVGLKSKFRMMVDTTGQPIANTEIGSVRREYVDNGAWLNDVAVAIVGDFSQLVYAIRLDPTYKILTEAVIQDPSTGKIIYNLGQQDMVALRFTMRLGWAIPNPVNSLQEDGSVRFPFAAIKGTNGLSTVAATFKVTTDGTTALANAKVVVGGMEKTTSSTGSVTFNIIPGNTYVYEVAANGYKPQFDEISITSAKTTTITLVVDPEASKGKNPADK